MFPNLLQIGKLLKKWRSYSLMIIISFEGYEKSLLKKTKAVSKYKTLS